MIIFWNGYICNRKFFNCYIWNEWTIFINLMCWTTIAFLGSSLFYPDYSLLFSLQGRRAAGAEETETVAVTGVAVPLPFLPLLPTANDDEGGGEVAELRKVVGSAAAVIWYDERDALYVAFISSFWHALFMDGSMTYLLEALFCSHTPYFRWSTRWCNSWGCSTCKPLRASSKCWNVGISHNFYKDIV